MNIPNNVTEFAVAGDWHRNTIYAISCLDVLAEKGINVIVHLGDFLHYGKAKARDEYLDSIQAVCQANNQTLLFIDGNHEDFPYIESLPHEEDGTIKVRDNIIYLPRAFTWEWDTVKFMALGGAPSINKRELTPNVSWFPQEKITPDEYEKAYEVDNVDVLFTHDCPSHVRIPNLDNENLPRAWKKELMNCNTQRLRLFNLCERLKPHYLFHGHYHRNYHDSLLYPEQEDDNKYTDVWGLDCDGKRFNDNYKILNLEDLKWRSV